MVDFLKVHVGDIVYEPYADINVYDESVIEVHTYVVHIINKHGTFLRRKSKYTWIKAPAKHTKATGETHVWRKPLHAVFTEHIHADNYEHKCKAFYYTERAAFKSISAQLARHKRKMASLERKLTKILSKL